MRGPWHDAEDGSFRESLLRKATRDNNGTGKKCETNI